MSKKQFFRIVVIIALILAFCLQSIVLSKEENVQLARVIEIDGEQYVNLKDVSLYQEQRITALVEHASPSVVAIVGKNGSVNSANRFALSHGTGVAVSEDGWILTNAHVIDNLQQITVIMSDGSKYPITSSIEDEESDLALVKINQTNVSFLPFAQEPSEVGETVVAIGTPISFSLRNSATTGIVSGVERSVASSYRLIQTDAAINPGNSGGPLMNLQGEIVGINTLKYAATGIESLSFAIPSDTVQYVIRHLLDYGHVKRVETGMEFGENWEAVVGLPTKEPLKIEKVRAGSPAAIAGVTKGDTLYSIDGQKIHTMMDYTEKLKHYLPGDKISLIMLAKGDLVKRTILLNEKK